MIVATIFFFLLSFVLTRSSILSLPPFARVPATQSQESLTFRGTLKGHAGWVTAISTSLDAPDTLLSSSRDKSLIVWSLTRDAETYGVPHRRLNGYARVI